MDTTLTADNFLINKMDRTFSSDGAVATRRFKALPDHLYSDLKDEAAILSIATGKYYGLNAVGVVIWKAIQKPATLGEVEDAVMQEYDVDQETCRREILSFLTKMADEKLIELIDEKSV